MVTEMVEDEDGFVVVLIDEVESLTKARSSAGSGSEPSDSLRVVNALLTQLDKLKQRKNCLVMTTSNISDSIGELFVLNATRWDTDFARQTTPSLIGPTSSNISDLHRRKPSTRFFSLASKS